MEHAQHPLRWIAPLAYVASLDGLLVVIGLSTAFDPDGTGMFDAGFVALGICAFAAFVANIVECIVLLATKAEGRLAFSRRAMLLCKVGLIPFFCLCGIVMVVLLLLAIHPVLAAMGLLAVPVAAATGWLIMMGGSTWAIAYAVGLRSERRISTVECVAHSVMQTIFFADVIDAIVLFFRGRTRETPANVSYPPYQGKASQ